MGNSGQSEQLWKSLFNNLKLPKNKGKRIQLHHVDFHYRMLAEKLSKNQEV